MYDYTMNSRERTEAVLSGQMPDRIPVDLHNFLVTARLMGVTDFAGFFRDGEAMAQAQLMAWKRFGHDVLIVENGTAALAQACGVNVVYQSDSAPVAKEPAISSLDEVDQLQMPDPERDPLLKELLLATRIIAREIGDQAFIIGRGDQGPFSLACEIRGMEAFMLDIALGEEDEKVHHLLDFCRQVTERYCLAQIQAGAHATSIGDSPSGPDLLSPRMYRKYAYPYARKLFEVLQAHGVRIAYHICGNATPIINDMVASGANILEIDQKADPSACRAAAAGKTTLLGPVDPSAVMANGTPADVTEACRAAIVALGPDRLILGPGCALPATTPDENIDAMIEAAKRFGTL